METPTPNNPPYKHFSPVSFLAGLLIALTLFFVIYKLVPHNAISEKNSTLKDSPKVEQQIVSANKKAGIDFTEEHFYKEHHHRHIDQDAEPIVVSPKEMTALEKGNLSEQQKKLLELLPNAPVIYILNFKITDYQNLYFDMGEPLVLKNKIVAGQLLHDALKDFSEQNFVNCFNKMTLLSLANPNDVNALFYGGMAAYYKKDYAEAGMRFEKAIVSKNNSFKQEGCWFMAMSLLENNKKEEAKKLLQQIIDGKGFYTNRATEKLKQLH